MRSRIALFGVPWKETEASRMFFVSVSSRSPMQPEPASSPLASTEAPPRTATAAALGWAVLMAATKPTRFPPRAASVIACRGHEPAHLYRYGPKKREWSNQPRPGGRVGCGAQTCTVSELQEQASDRRRPLQLQNTSDDSPVRPRGRFTRPHRLTMLMTACSSVPAYKHHGRFIGLFPRPIHP